MGLAQPLDTAMGNRHSLAKRSGAKGFPLRQRLGDHHAGQPVPALHDLAHLVEECGGSADVKVEQNVFGKQDVGNRDHVHFLRPRSEASTDREDDRRPARIAAARTAAASIAAHAAAETVELPIGTAPLGVAAHVAGAHHPA